MRFHLPSSVALSLFLAIAGSAAACGGKVATVDGADNGGATASSGEAARAPAPADEPAVGAGEVPPSPPSPGTSPPPGSCASFAAVLNTLVAHGCAVSACHGKGLSLPLIDPAQPLATQRGFYDFFLSDGSLYVDLGSIDPTRSSISCNLRGTCGVPMPIGQSLLSPSELETVDRWLRCGARE